jgi:hypothetical protein
LKVEVCGIASTARDAVAGLERSGDLGRRIVKGPPAKI